ncbi:hypothetical protein, partial [Mesorhizobium sp. M7A.F.Ca.CA.001.08.1.1]|uniref:hypothetical protein n=1 Tax=Mesorhizobium sp. M7A.F.Ca.CA.001.08.1.1 TaxID=2496691 RepID=UPI0019D18184
MPSIRQHKNARVPPTRVSYYLAVTIFALRCNDARAGQLDGGMGCRLSFLAADGFRLQGRCIMSLRINDIAPDFTAE